MWQFYFELTSGFIDSYSFESLEDCIDCRESCIKDNSIKRTTKIFYNDSVFDEEKD